MLKIGEFSKVAQVSVKTLRLYGELGLLRPAWIDRYTGYRYYTLEQLPRLNRILALKDLGFSLEQIKQLLREDLPASQLRGMVRLKCAELQQRIQEEQDRLARVEARLQQIEQEGHLPGYSVVLKRVEPQRVGGIRRILPDYRAMFRLVAELHTALQVPNSAPVVTGPYLGLYYDAEYRDRGVDAEAAAPLARAWRGVPGVTAHDLPGVETMACVIHQGSYERLHEAYNTLMAWTQANGFRVIGPNREIYLQGPEPELPPSRYITEVQLPVEKVTVISFTTSQKEQETMETADKGQGTMEPRIVTKPAFTVVGMRYQGRNQHNEIAQMWDVFNPRIGEIADICGPAYGVCITLADAPEGEFEYIAGMEVNAADQIPAGMVSRSVPEQTYAVFPCTLRTLHQAYDYAYHTWLPQSGYQVGGDIDFELYGEEFDPEDAANSTLYIYIPIKPK